jgi:hypothetical protein
VTTLVVLLVIAGLILGFLVAVAIERGPSIGDLAVAYERAWDRLDFATLWAVSGPGLRDGLTRRQFLAAKRAAYARGDHPVGLVERTELDDVAVAGEVAVAHTRLALRDGNEVRNEVRMERRMGRWQVTDYRLRDGDPRPPIHTDGDTTGV